MNTQDIKDSKNLNAPSKGNVPALRFPEFTEEWTAETIDELFELRNGYTPSKNNLDFWNNGTIPWFRMEDIRLNGGVLKDAIQHITPEAVKGSGLFEPYSIILATTATIGEHAMLIADSLANQRFTNFKIRKSLTYKYNPYYLYYYFFKIDKWCLKNTNAGGLLSVDIPSLKRQKLYSPSVEEQNKIAKLLRLIDDRISIQSRIIQKYKSLIKAMCDTLIERETQQVTLSFSDFGQSYSGLSGKSAEDFGDGYPFITYMNVYQNQIIDSTDMGLVKIKAREQQSVVRHGDILLTLSSETPEEVGMGAVYFGKTYPLYLNSFCFGIHITDESMIYPPFLAYYVSSQLFRKAVYPLAQGSTRFNLQKSDFMKKKFSFPLIEKQRQIYSILNAYSNKLIVEKQIMRLLCNQKCHLLRQLFI